MEQLARDISSLILLCVGIVVAIYIGICAACFYAGGWAVESSYQQQALERGYAEHDAKTGEWRWKE